MRFDFHNIPKTAIKRFPFLTQELAQEIVSIIKVAGIQRLAPLWPQYNTQEIKQLYRQAEKEI